MFGFGFSAGAHFTPVSTNGLRPSATCHPCRGIVMMAEGKKKPAYTFSQDMKGMPLWTLRAAKEEDAEAIVKLGGEAGRLNHALISSMFAEDNGGSVVCEATVKGTKNGDAFRGVVLGSVVADVSVSLKDVSAGLDGGLFKEAELLAVDVSPEMPDGENTKKKLVLGAMKRLKTNGVSNAIRELPQDDSNEVEFYQSLGFEADGNATAVRNSKTVVTRLTAKLATVNADPGKKLML